MTPQIPGVILAEEIGVGGFGTVYRGVQTLIGRDVAVKLDSRSLTDERDRRRFEREITAAGRVSAHPNIVSLYDAGITAEGRPFLVMEMYTGGSYAARMKRTPPIPTGEVLDVGIAIADALAAAHDEGILHRDVKPGNILISRYGTPALTDFGLAALPRPGAEASVTLEALTPAYSSPESFALTPPSAATDIFGLGSTLYALLKGGPPRSDSSGQSPSLPHLLFLLNQPLPALDSRPEAGELMKVIQRATQTLPANRYATAAQMRDDLMLIKAGYPIIRPQSPRGIPATPAQIPPDTNSESPTTGSGVSSLSPVGEPTGPVAGTLPSKSRTKAIAVAAAVVLLLIATATAVASQLTPDTPPGTARAAGSSASTTNTPATLNTPATPATDSDQQSDAQTAPKPPEGSQTVQTPPAPQVGQCFGGLVTIGDSRTASTVGSCGDPHYWESFAGGELDPATAGPLLNDVLQDPKVLATCTRDALGGYLGSVTVDDRYNIEVLPPREALFYQGDRGFHCVAALAGAGEVTTGLKGN